MKKIVFIIVISCVVILMGYLLIPYLVKESSKKSDSPFKYSLDEFKEVDESLLSHEEVRQINLPENEYVDLYYYQNRIFLLTKNQIKIISPEGSKISEIPIQDNASAFTICSEELLYVCFGNKVLIYNSEGLLINESLTEPTQSYFSSIAVGEDKVFVADAGRRKVLVYDKELNKNTSFTGESGVSEVHGFIVPSNQFSLTLNTDDELWVVNPGLHAIQNYSHTGRLRGYWSKTSFEPDGFTGCCNPCFIKFLNNGKLLTSEKGLVRVKIHRESGELVSVVAPPRKFKSGGSAPAITSDENNNIIILDFDNNMIRFFNKTVANNKAE